MSLLKSIDFELLIPVLIFISLGLITNYPASGFSFDSLFFKQSIFFVLFLITIFTFANINYNFLKGPFTSLFLYFGTIITLTLLLFFAPEINQVRSWIIIGEISIQPSDFAKIVLIIVLARYFATRHIYAKHLRHVLVSLSLASVLFILTTFQPDFGSAFVFLAIWAGMIFVSGIGKKQILYILLLITMLIPIAWGFFLTDYQKDRVLSFLDQTQNIQSEGYNLYQSKIAIGSGGLFGKGIGEGTQSKLNFLPLYETDFMFAAFAEEWGFVGVILFFVTFFILIAKLIYLALNSRGNFESLFIIGFVSSISAHFFIHIGANVGLIPVTGLTLPFMSYGGSHLIAEAIALGLIMSMGRNRRAAHMDEVKADRVYG